MPYANHRFAKANRKPADSRQRAFGFAECFIFALCPVRNDGKKIISNQAFSISCVRLYAKNPYIGMEKFISNFFKKT